MEQISVNLGRLGFIIQPPEKQSKKLGGIPFTLINFKRLWNLLQSLKRWLILEYKK